MLQGPIATIWGSPTLINALWGFFLSDLVHLDISRRLLIADAIVSCLAFQRMNAQKNWACSPFRRNRETYIYLLLYRESVKISPETNYHSCWLLIHHHVIMTRQDRRSYPVCFVGGNMNTFMQCVLFLWRKWNPALLLERPLLVEHRKHQRSTSRFVVLTVARATRSFTAAALTSIQRHSICSLPCDL